MTEDNEKLYPECDKLLAVNAKCQIIGEFLEWLYMTENVQLAHYPEEGNTLYPYNKPLNKLLASFFDIDMDKVEKERMAMIESMRKINELIEKQPDRTEETP